MKTIAFLGTKEIGAKCLAWLLENMPTKEWHVSVVLTNQRCLSKGIEENVTTLANRAGIPIAENLEQFLSFEDVDLIVSVQYHKLLHKQHIKKARFLAVNYHMAPLPEYRGCNQFSFALINGDKEFGTTLHRLEEGIDNGAIIAERRFPIPDNCYVDELYRLTFNHTLTLFKESIPNLLEGHFTLTSQENYLDKRRCEVHLRREIEDLKKIDLSWEKSKIERYIRATAMPGFPPPYSIIGGKTVHFVVAKS